MSSSCLFWPNKNPKLKEFFYNHWGKNISKSKLINKLLLILKQVAVWISVGGLTDYSTNLLTVLHLVFIKSIKCCGISRKELNCRGLNMVFSGSVFNWGWKQIEKKSICFSLAHNQLSMKTKAVKPPPSFFAFYVTLKMADHYLLIMIIAWGLFHIGYAKLTTTLLNCSSSVCCTKYLNCSAKLV